MSSQSRCLDWKPATQKIEKTPESEPTKPTKPSFDGFVGSDSLESPITQAAPDPVEVQPDSGPGPEPSAPKGHAVEPAIDVASKILGETGCQLVELDGVVHVAVWADLDCVEIRAAAKAYGNPPIVYLDDPGVPVQFKERFAWADGEPVPRAVLQAMLQNPIDPWRTRDEMLAAMHWRPKGIPWATWKAEQINRLYDALGVLGGQPSHIMPAAVAHGLERTAEGKR